MLQISLIQVYCAIHFEQLYPINLNQPYSFCQLFKMGIHKTIGNHHKPMQL